MTEMQIEDSQAIRPFEEKKNRLLLLLTVKEFRDIPTMKPSFNEVTVRSYLKLQCH